ncbi:hypothetical protein [Streptomyces sp. NPDC057552]|uniref:hypothetical protein n=1 Tax=Streptomyces sp. NPDC057552 TaxID=3350537 RepID=UPI0036C7EF7F
MSEWAIALITAGAAIVGGAVTGWYSRSAGIRQAEAARLAGERQAEAALETVRMTLRDQAAVRVLDLRRQTYVRFLHTAERAVTAARTGVGGEEEAVALPSALAEVGLEGPPEVYAAARRIADGLRRNARPDDLEDAKEAFIAAAQRCLRPGPGPE